MPHKYVATSMMHMHACMSTVCVWNACAFTIYTQVCNYIYVLYLMYVSGQDCISH